jgi:UDP-N-acetylmuramate dehydrogenase
MIIRYNTSLKKYNTFGLGYRADCLISIRSEKDAIALFGGSKSYKKPLLILGGGSNILFTADFKGTIIHPEFGGIKVEQEDGGTTVISAGAGVEWDKLVEWSVARGLYGLENLSLIPGNVGASPVQNIGAYGVEVKDSIEKVKTISVRNGSVRFFSKNECEFGYRNSIFKNKLKGEYLVTRVYFRVSTDPVININYGALKDEVNKLGATTLKNIREAVINIRKDKLPDPSKTGNAGSFFKNPVISNTDATLLKEKYPLMPVYDDISGGTKLAAGWLTEQCGWKGKRSGDAGVHEKQALVLVNYGNASGEEIFSLSESIRESVRKKFGIELEREVEVIGVT